ncbi:S1C family serine protease [Sediminibacterium roseum]|nr:trypsin-like peptidase domain-containing protein [Sediminibacterium roseum]
MDDILLLEAIERYLSNDMDAAERAYFETLRKNTPEIDQMVVEHSMFLHQMDIYSVHRNLKNSLQATHAKLLGRGEINEGGELTTKGRVIQLWNKYKRVTAIAASVGGVIALVISGLMVYFAPVGNSQLEQLSREMNAVKGTLGYLKADAKSAKKTPKNITFVSGGSGFLIDTKGYIVTNAHVLKGTGAVVVNSKGQSFQASIISIDKQKDLAILKISDAEYVQMKSLPYGIRKSSVDLSEGIFTLGYPRNDIVYGEGYVSARTGFNGDTLSYQVQISANPGNSGAPVFDNSGEVIGIISTRQAEAEGVAFAIKSKNIYRMIEDLRDENDSTLKKIKMPTRSYLRGVDRKQQIAKVEDCVFYVKAYND